MLAHDEDVHVLVAIKLEWCLHRAEQFDTAQVITAVKKPQAVKILSQMPATDHCFLTQLIAHIERDRKKYKYAFNCRSLTWNKESTA